MGNLFAELKRRHIYRVAAAYAVIAWLLLQLVNNLTPALKLPEWAATFVVVLIAVGFPIALLFCWIQHLPADGAGPQPKAKRLDFILIGGLAAVVLLIAYQQLASNVAPTAQQSGVEASKAAANSPAGAISIAVLPFANLSGDASQEFFSDGMTEEITSALARVPDLRVVARTSAYEFKGKNLNIKTMGEQLGATHLIEGSVRKAGDRLRITAQLIKADDGTHIWAEDYNRQLTDIFAIQEDIARAITASLRMPLGLKPGENLVNNRDIDPESYGKYLRARRLFIGLEGTRDVAQADQLLQEVVAKFPDYAPAWGFLGAVYVARSFNVAGDVGIPIVQARVQAEELRTKGEAAGRKAVQLDPNLAQANGNLGVWAWSRGKTLEADEFFTKALTLDPNDADILYGVGSRLGSAGRVKEVHAIMEKAHATEPFAPQMLLSAALYSWLDGQNDAAIALARTMRPGDRAPMLALIYASLGRYGEAADALNEIAGNPDSPEAQAARLLRTAPGKTTSPEQLPRLPNRLEFVYLFAGAPDRAIGDFERRVEVGVTGGGNNSLASVWHPSYAPVRKTERFKTLVRKAGLVDYWRAKGWPEFCRSTSGDDFVCD